MLATVTCDDNSYKNSLYYNLFLLMCFLVWDGSFSINREGKKEK